MIPRRPIAANPALLMLAALGSLGKEEEPKPKPAPESQCDGCVYKRMPSDGGHCYMFAEEPKPCGQRKPEPTGGAK